MREGIRVWACVAQERGERGGKGRREEGKPGCRGDERKLRASRGELGGLGRPKPCLGLCECLRTLSN